MEADRWFMVDWTAEFPAGEVRPLHGKVDGDCVQCPYPELSIKYAGEPVHPQTPLENGPDSVQGASRFALIPDAGDQLAVARQFDARPLVGHPASASSTEGRIRPRDCVG
ncbi:MAG TPA: hypothetical protein VGN51_05175 [Acidimicrobiia bacterium]